MANQHSILKSRDITLPTKVHIIKAIVFPVVMCECESWTIKNAKELMLLNCRVGEDCGVESLLDCKETKLVHPKGDKS